jgi:hypothetical protein
MGESMDTHVLSTDYADFTDWNFNPAHPVILAKERELDNLGNLEKWFGTTNTHERGWVKGTGFSAPADCRLGAGTLAPLKRPASPDL